MDNALVKWNTGRLINKELDKLKFFAGYKTVHSDITEIYEHLCDYSHNNYRNLGSYESRHYGFNQVDHDALIDHLDKILEFQVFISEQEEIEDNRISEKAKQLFGNENIAEAACVDLHKINQLNMLLEYSEPIRELFNYILPLTNEVDTLQPGTESEIREILEAKGLGTFQVPEHLLINTQENLQEV